MRKSKHPTVRPDTAKARSRSEKRTWQLARAVWGDGESDWTAVHVATAIARIKSGEVVTGYFDPKSTIVKKANAQGARYVPAEPDL